MSFSGEVKDELAKQLGKSRHCQIAELAAIIAFDGKIERHACGDVLEITTENPTLARKCFTLIKKTFNIGTDIETRSSNGSNRNHIYVISTADKEQIERILSTLKLTDLLTRDTKELALVDALIVQKACCRRAFIRGAFLSAGSMSDPEKSYH